MRRPIKTMARKRWFLVGIDYYFSMNKHQKLKVCPFDTEERSCAEMCGKIFPEILDCDGLIDKCPCYHPMLGPAKVEEVFKQVLEAAKD